MNKLFIIVRNDLSTSQRAVQAGHAVAQFCMYGSFSRWSNGTLIYLQVKGLAQLERLKFKLEFRNISFVVFREPDLGNQITAIATDVQCKLFEKLNLM